MTDIESAVLRTLDGRGALEYWAIERIATTLLGPITFESSQLRGALKLLVERGLVERLETGSYKITRGHHAGVWRREYMQRKTKE